ncbi:alpha-L-fucosidase, partial [Draconibacterium sp.]|nr:alpha-L-fucosidase [Draconibacterium sp.]
EQFVMDKKEKWFSARGLLIILLVITTQAHAQEEIHPYGETAEYSIGKELNIIDIKPTDINVLSAVNAKLSSNLTPIVKNFMFLWTQSIASGSYCVEWSVQSPEAGTYEITCIISGQDAKLVLSCNGKQQPELEVGKDWSRITLGTIGLKKGINKVQIDISAAKDVKLSGVELTRPPVKKQMIQEALKMRKNADWFKDAGYGLMFQWTNRATPENGNEIKNWDQKINDFDIEAFVDMVQQTGAAYIIWSITWGQQYISAPIISLDKLIEGRTTKRDLLGEMANRLHEKDIKLIFYYHYGYDCYHSKDSAWLQAAGGYKEDKTELYHNISTILSEVGNRYGDKLDGWFFDGGRRYYDSHFDGSSAGILSANFKDITQAARTGNAKRIIAYNSWILPRSTEYQDYYAGEGYQQFTDLDEGVFPCGKYKGLMAHTCFPLEKRWGHIDWNTTIASPKYSIEQLIEWVQYAQQNSYPLSINLEMYEDGSASAESLELLKKVRMKIRGK